MKHTITIGIAVAAFVASAGCGGRGSKPIARVFGDHISQDDLYHYMDNFGTPSERTVLVRTASGETNAQLSDPMPFQAMRRMLIRQATIELAKSHGVAPTAADVNNELTFRGHLQQGYMTDMTRGGLTLSRLKDLIAFELARENLLSEGVKITTQYATDFVKDHQADFMEPATADLLWILVRSQAKMKEVDKELDAGQDFQTVAREKSEAPDAGSDARFGQTRVETMDPAIQKVVAATPEQVASRNWLAFPRLGGYAKFYVRKKASPKPIDMNQFRIEQLRRSLAQSRGAMAKDLDQDVLDFMLVNRSKFAVEDKDLKALWDKWLDDMERAGKAGGSAATPSS